MSSAYQSNTSTTGDWVTASQWAIMPNLCRLTLFMSVLGNGIDIARVTDRSEGVSLSFQVVLRLLITFSATLCGAWGWWRLVEVRRLFHSIRGLLALVLVMGAYMSVITAPSPNVAFFVATALCVYSLMTATCVVLRGVAGTLADAMFALWCYVLISWVLRVVAPDLTVFNEYLNSEETLTRFGGLGHPNVLAAVQCLGMLLLLDFTRRGYIRKRWLIPAAVVMLATLIETKSRTPVIAFLAAATSMSILWARRGSTYLLAAMGCAILFVGAIAVEMTVGLDYSLQQLSLRLTKTGSVDELTSATGRTEIWSRALDLIAKSPLTGYGGGSSSQVMVEHSGHAHNLLLETAVLFGIPVAFLFFCLICCNIRDAIRDTTFFVRPFTVFLLVLGLVESPLFGLVPDPSMCIWFTCLFGPVIEHQVAQRRFYSTAAG